MSGRSRLHGAYGAEARARPPLCLVSESSPDDGRGADAHDGIHVEGAEFEAVHAREVRIFRRSTHGGGRRAGVDVCLFVCPVETLGKVVGLVILQCTIATFGGDARTNGAAPR